MSILSAANALLERWNISVWIVLFTVGNLPLLLVAREFPPTCYGLLLWLWFPILLIGIWVLAWAKTDDNGHEDNQPTYSKKLYIGIAFLPWAVATLFYVNGNFDRSAPERHQAVVQDRSEPRRLGKQLIVSSWRERQASITIPVGSAEYSSMLPGTRVVVEVKQGALSIPWTFAVRLH